MSKIEKKEVFVLRRTPEPENILGVYSTLDKAVAVAEARLHEAIDDMDFEGDTTITQGEEQYGTTEVFIQEDEYGEEIYLIDRVTLDESV